MAFLELFLTQSLNNQGRKAMNSRYKLDIPLLNKSIHQHQDKNDIIETL